MNKSMVKISISSTNFILFLILIIPNAFGEDVIDVKRMTLDLANEIAMSAVQSCRKKGYQVSVAVVDRSGITQVLVRDVLASRFTMQIAENKANSVILSGIDSGTLRKNRQDIRPELNHIDGLIIMRGAIPIRAAGSLIGAVGVSGAPGGNIDEECATEAMSKIQDRLEFIGE